MVVSGKAHFINIPVNKTIIEIMNSNNLIITALILLFSIGRIQAQGIVSKVNLFKDGDRICFTGNSITHAGSYHSLLYLFYLTRFPERNIEVFNCGISGDNIGGTLKRFNKDIAVHVPSVATIKLGTNDICPELYFNSAPQNDPEKVKANTLYRSNMMELVRRLDSMRTKIIFLTPAYFEEKPRLNGMISVGINRVFEQYGQFLDSLRMQYKAGLVDFHFILDSISHDR